MNVSGEVYVAIYARKLRKVQVRIFNAVRTVKRTAIPHISSQTSADEHHT